MAEWTIITNHGLILTHIAKHPRCTTREIASAIKVTEWTVHKIISDLEVTGYVQRQRVGRSNAYQVNPNAKLRHETTSHVLLRDFLQLLSQAEGFAE